LDYRPGDHVKRLNYHTNDEVGVVTHILPKTFKVRVQWAWGSNAEAPEEIYPVSKIFFPTNVSYNAAYDSWENSKSEREYGIGLPNLPKKHHDAAVHKVALRFSDHIAEISEKAEALKEASVSDIQAYLKLSSIYKGTVSDELLKDVVTFVYG
jgi:hypothetical protein